MKRHLETSLLFCLIFSIVLFGLDAKADLRPEVIEIKSKLEDSITKRYRERILTRIPSELFNVSVVVEIALKSEDPTDDQKDVLDKTAGKNSSFDLSDISLGIIQSSQISETALANKPNTTWLDRIQIKKVEVTLGLSAKLGQNYINTFKPWLTSTVKSDFANLGVARFSEIAAVPKDEEPVKPEPEQKPRVLTFEEKFGNFQTALGLIVFSIVGLMALLLHKFLLSKDVKEQMGLALRIQEQQLAQKQLESASSKTKLLNDAKKTDQSGLTLTANILFDSFREHQRKVALLALSPSSPINAALDRWFEEGTDGRKKIATLIDCVLAFYGEKAASSEFEMPLWTLPDRVKMDKELPDVFLSFSTLELPEKTKLVERTYWDLLSIKTLGDKQAFSPFSSMTHLPMPRMQKILNQQDKKIKTLAILHLPQEKMEEVVSVLSLDEKKSLVLEAYANPKIKTQDLQLADQSLKFFIKKENTSNEDFIDIQSLIPNMLSTLSATEEIQLLEQILPSLPDNGFFLKQNYPSLGFLNEWPKDKLKILLTGLPVNDLLAIVKAIPSLLTQVIDVIPARTQTILKDSMNKTVSADDSERSLQNLRIKLFAMINDGQVDLTQIFKSLKQETKSAA